MGYCGQPKSYVMGELDPRVHPNLEYQKPLLQSVLDKENPNLENFDFRVQKIHPKGQYKLSEHLFENIFSDMYRDCEFEEKNAVIIGGHSLFMKDGLAFLLSRKVSVKQGLKK